VNGVIKNGLHWTPRSVSEYGGLPGRKKRGVNRLGGQGWRHEPHQKLNRINGTEKSDAGNLTLAAAPQAGSCTTPEHDQITRREGKKKKQRKQHHYEREEPAGPIL